MCKVDPLECILTFRGVSESRRAFLLGALVDDEHHTNRHQNVDDNGHQEQDRIQFITVVTHWGSKHSSGASGRARGRWGQLTRTANVEKLWLFFKLTLSLHVEIIICAVVFTVVGTFLCIFHGEVLACLILDLNFLVIFILEPFPVSWTGHCELSLPEWHSSLKHTDTYKVTSASLL